MRALAVALLFSGLPALAEDVYKKPPKEILDVLNAPESPRLVLSPTRHYALLVHSERYPSIADLAQPMLRLAGARVNPATNGPHRSGFGGNVIAVSLKKIADGAETKIPLPPNPRFSAPEWSPDGKSFAAASTVPNGVELWTGDVSGKFRRLNVGRLNSAFGDPIRWMPDSRTLLVNLVPSGRGNPPAAPAAPKGPNIQESSGRAGPVRTLQDLLRNAHDEIVYDYYATAQLALVDTTDGAVTTVGKPAVFQGASPSPDGKLLLVTRIVRPYSYLHASFSFPKDVEVWDRAGKVVHKLASLPLADRVPIEGVATGPRGYHWRPTDPATLAWVEALDGGNPREKVPHRDRILMAKAPAFDRPVELFKTEHRFRSGFGGGRRGGGGGGGGFPWIDKGGLVFLGDYDRDRRWERTFLVNADNPAEPPRLVWSHGAQDRYKDPGNPVGRALPTGHGAILRSGDSIYLDGQGATPQGDRPFLDRLNLKTLQSERLFRSDDKSLEQFVTLLAEDGSSFLTRRESPSEPPNFYVRTAAGPRALTQFPDPAPQLRGIKKQLVTYKRPDGVTLSFTLYLPPGHQPGTRLPTFIWAYPLEYNDPDTAGQVVGSPQRFTSIGGASHLFFLLAGYAILDNATMPVVGDPLTVNNTYVEQIVMSARAAIDKAVEMGVTDRDRVGVGGHSYGAFMTANLLAHSELFRAGIARSGAYNRTLTPFGFQSERRTVWEAPELYAKMSPFLHAQKINEPILLIHGEADNNAGTFPIQSDRLYQAVRGLGGTVRLVMLPHESHGYAARESIEHTLHEMVGWLDKYVKNAPPRAATGSGQ